MDDVLVVGAGLVGPALALALARADVRVTLIDTTPPGHQPSDDTRPIALSLASVRLLSALRLWPSLAAHAQPIRTIHVSEAGRFAKVRLRAEECGVPAFGQVVNAGHVAGAFAQALESESAVRVLPATGTIRWQQDGGRGRLLLGGGPHSDDPHSDDDAGRRGTGGPPCTVLESPLVLLADGGTDRLADAPLSVRRRDYAQMAVACAPRVSRAHDAVAFERFRADGPLALLPLVGQRAGLVWTLAPEPAQRLMAATDDAFCAALGSAFGSWLGTFSDPGRRGCFPLSLRDARVTDPSAPLLLLGNAALQLHPVAGQGLNLALRDVACLVDLLGEGRTGLDVRGAALRLRFESLRAADRRRVRAATDTLVRVFGVRRGPVRMARGPAMLALALSPGLKRRLAVHAMGLAPPQARLLRQQSSGLAT